LPRQLSSSRTHQSKATFSRLFSSTVVIVSRLSPSEWKRRCIHMLPALLPFVLWAIPHKDPLSWDCRAWMVSVIVGIGVFTLWQFPTIVRRGEYSGMIPIFGYSGAVLLTILAFPAYAELGLVVLAVLAVGDGSATIGGLMFRGPRLPWNPDKTWAGSFCFLICSAPFAALVYWGEAHPAVPFRTAAICGTTATIVAAISESLSSRIDDNIRVGATASMSVVAAHALLVGLS